MKTDQEWHNWAAKLKLSLVIVRSDNGAIAYYLGQIGEKIKIDPPRVSVKPAAIKFTDDSSAETNLERFMDYSKGLAAAISESAAKS